MVEIASPEPYALTGGPFGSELVRADYRPVGVPIIRGVNLASDLGFSLDELVFVSEEKARALRANTARPGDLVFTQRGTLGQVGLIPLTSPYELYVISQSQMKLTVDQSVADPTFVYYCFRDAGTVRRISDLASSSGVPHINLNTFRQFEICLPPIEIQRDTASKLRVFDALIANNTRRIELLEATAHLIFREWFVEDRSADQLASVGEAAAKTRPLSAISSYINRGISPRYDPAARGRVINQRCIRDHRLTLENARAHASRVPAEKMVKFGDVLVNSTGVGTLGRVAQVYDQLADHTVDSHVTIVRASPNIDLDWFGLALQQLESYFERQGAGATGQTELGRARVSETPIDVPPADLQRQFGQTVRPIRELANKLAALNASLRATRALLLPRLLSPEGNGHTAFAEDEKSP